MKRISTTGRGWALAGFLLFMLAGCAHLDHTALHRAVTAGDVKTVERLLNRGADANARDEQGNTPLHLLAARSSQTLTFGAGGGSPGITLPISGQNETSIASMLLTNGADANAPNMRGQTPLHLAVIHEKADLAGLLIASGADLGARDKAGKTPADLALLRGLAGLTAILQQNATQLGPPGK